MMVKWLVSNELKEENEGRGRLVQNQFEKLKKEVAGEFFIGSEVVEFLAVIYSS